MQSDEPHPPSAFALALRGALDSSDAGDICSSAGIVAVSGGPDSVALLRGLCELHLPGGLTVAHFQHRLRGDEGEADCRFVSTLAVALKLPFATASADTRSIAVETSSNLEDTARRLRYEWLGQLAKDRGAAWVATGHTASDQAETVLHRLLRGTGIQGLRGIAPCRLLLDRVSLLRPMLAISRPEVIAYLNSLGQSYRVDSSNADPRFTRNRIRHELVPLLSTYNPAIESILCRLAEQAVELHGEHEAAARELLCASELPRAGASCILDKSRLVAAPRTRVREMLRLLWEREHWPLGEMGFEHWDRAAAVALGEATATDLPGQVHVRARERVVQVGRR